MMRFVFLLLLQIVIVKAFFPLPWHLVSSSPLSSSISLLRSVSDNGSDIKVLEPKNVYQFLEQVHTSGYPFRTIVVGNGAILESTQALGSSLQVNKSPTTGETLLTMANDDKSFEFHIRIQQIHKIAIVERNVTDKVLRIIRFSNADEVTMCSLILADYTDDAAVFIEQLKQTYGTEFYADSTK
jgi:putative heme iron utilization protein